MRSRIDVVATMAILVALFTSGCGIGEEVLLRKFEVEAGNANDPQTVVIDTTPETFRFTVSWKTNAPLSYSVDLSVVDAKIDDGNVESLLYIECDDRGDILCEKKVSFQCEISEDYQIHCLDEEFHVDMSELTVDTTAEILFKLKICDLFNNRCERQVEKLIFAETDDAV